MVGVPSFITTTRLLRDVFVVAISAPVERGSRRNAAASIREMAARGQPSTGVNIPSRV
jgi:hypothetical protein